MKLVLATLNEHKRREMQALLPAHELTSLPGDVALPPEDGASYAENALGKARAAAAALGVPAIADDSGIEAAALGGAPGIRSARFAGAGATDAANLAELRRRAPAGSALTYVCALAYVEGDTERVFEGLCTGRMAPAPHGSGGFGYDPVFLPDDDPAGRTMAELTQAEKDAISHRGRAARELARWLSLVAG